MPHEWSSKRNETASAYLKHHQRRTISILHALSSVVVPQSLLHGVPVQQVAANGKTEPATLTLSRDKFTLTLSTSLYGGGIRSKTGTTTTKSCWSIFCSKNRRTPIVQRSIDIGEMDRILRGQSTRHFERAKNATANNNPVTEEDQLDPDRSFSIVFGGTETLDLLIGHGNGYYNDFYNSNTKSTTAGGQLYKAARDDLCLALDSILEAYQRAKVRVTPDVLLLRHVWMHVVDDRTVRPASLSFTNKVQPQRQRQVVYYAKASHWQKILPAMNLFMKPKDVKAAYEDFGKVIQLDRAARRRGLTFEQSAAFLHKIKRDSWMVKPVQVIWEELFGNVMNNGKVRTTVSENTFLEKFWHGCQGEDEATLVDVRKLFRRLHDMELAHNRRSALANDKQGVDLSRISYDQFEAYLLREENDAFDPSKEVLNVGDMDHPLSQYWINSSHKTYLTGDQCTSQSSVGMYSNALYRGCHCLEIEVWDGGKGPDGMPKPVAWHGRTLTSKIAFDEIVKSIKGFLDFHPDTFPIILSLENHCSIPYQEVMVVQLQQILGDSLFNLTKASSEGPLPSPNQLRGMVVIIVNDNDLPENEVNGGSASCSIDNSEVGLLCNKLRRKHEVAPELARLALFRGREFKNFDESVDAPSLCVHSFSEGKVRSRCRHTQSSPWFELNQTHMSRTYPGGARVDSSNYNPVLAWSVGCQMVALNFQTEDAFLRLNDGRFRENGQSGYVLKPSSLQANEPIWLTVQVLSGSCLPKLKGQREGNCIDPYVKVKVFDVVNEKGTETISTHQTDAVPQNGFFPIWHQGKFKILVQNRAVAMMQVTVYDRARENFIPSTSIPVSCLRKGIRSIKLYGSANTRSGATGFASLLLKITMGKTLETPRDGQDTRNPSRPVPLNDFDFRDHSFSNVEELLSVPSLEGGSCQDSCCCRSYNSQG